MFKRICMVAAFAVVGASIWGGIASARAHKASFNFQIRYFAGRGVDDKGVTEGVTFQTRRRQDGTVSVRVVGRTRGCEIDSIGRSSAVTDGAFHIDLDLITLTTSSTGSMDGRFTTPRTGTVTIHSSEGDWAAPNSTGAATCDRTVTFPIQRVKTPARFKHKHKHQLPHYPN